LSGRRDVEESHESFAARADSNQVAHIDSVLKQLAPEPP
jgi:hypothetical protein